MFFVFVFFWGGGRAHYLYSHFINQKIYEAVEILDYRKHSSKLVMPFKSLIAFSVLMDYTSMEDCRSCEIHNFWKDKRKSKLKNACSL